MEICEFPFSEHGFRTDGLEITGVLCLLSLYSATFSPPHARSTWPRR